MRVDEFSNGFDVLVDSYRRLRDFDSREAGDTIEFNEYEKSLYLTYAQEELVLGLYNGRNMLGESFEETEELRRYLSNLVTEATITPAGSDTPIGMGEESTFFLLPDGSGTEPAVWFITYESVKVSDGRCGDGTVLDVYPTTQDEYNKIKRNPFRGANDRRALRLDLKGNVAEIVCKYHVTEYYIRYMKKLKPIILADLPNGLTIEQCNTITACELHESLHQKILEMAVSMALRSRGGGGLSDHTMDEKKS